MYRVTIFVLLVTILFTPAFLQGGTFSDPEIPDGQILAYSYTPGEYKNKYLLEVKQREEVVESVSHISVTINDSGEKEYRILDQGLRRGGHRFQHISRLLVQKGGLLPLGFETQDSNPDGRIIRRFEAVFDDPDLDYPQDTYPVYNIVQVLRGMSFQEEDTVPFYIWVTPTEIFRMYFDVIKKETIEVPAGTFPCFYGEMRPDIRTILPVGNLLAKLLKPFIPRYHFWFSCAPSHPLVKFEGVLGAAGAAPHTIELTRIENPGPKGPVPIPSDAGEGLPEQERPEPPDDTDHRIDDPMNQPEKDI
jgi:hypothetical protein